MKYEIFAPGSVFTITHDDEKAVCAVTIALGEGKFLTEPFTPSIWHMQPREIEIQWIQKYKMTMGEWYAITGNKQKMFQCLESIQYAPVYLLSRIDSFKEQLKWRY